MKRLIAALLVVVCVASSARAQDSQLLHVSVTFASGRGVFVDQGRASGMAVGLRVRFFPPGSSPVEGVVRAVSTDSALVELPEGIPLPPVGTKGEVEVETPIGAIEEKQKPTTPKPTQRKREVPAHPPWTRQEGELTPDTPLLAPAFGQRPQDRPVEYKGRIYSQLLYTKDRGNNRDNDYVLGRLGIWIEAKNLFGQGGEMLFAGEVINQGADLLKDEDGTTNNNIRIDRLAYTIGEQKYSLYRLELGRFYSSKLPELGLIDGAEVMLKVKKGLQIGAGLGVYPDPFPLSVAGEDASLHMFMDYQSEAWHHLSAVIAYQKTWHEGTPDRDLLLGKINMRPTKTLWFYTSWKVDIYLAGDSIKSQGLDLTEFWAQLRYTARSNVLGAAVSISHYAWPELERREFRDLPAELVRNGKIDRLNLSGWLRASKRLRFASRFDLWEDQDTSGTGGEISADWTDPSGTGPSMHVAIFYTDGSFNDGTGFRIQARQGLGSANGFVGYELFRYSNVGSIGGDEDEFTRHTLRSGLDWSLNNWHYSLSADYIFGDGEQSYTVGLYTQYRF